MFQLLQNSRAIVKEFSLPATEGKENWKIATVKNVSLKKGSQSFVISIIKGGFNLVGVQFEKIK
ncbi:MAG: hypothetical protein WDO71_00990 [Bacteroidota bacterium]